MTYIVVDLETTMKCPVGNNKANPMWFGNKVVVGGSLFEGRFTISPYAETIARECVDDLLLVGQNLKFDMLYLRRHWEKIPKNIWDIQLAEYLLTGQQSRYASLDSMSAKYGGTLKDDRIKAMWEAGVPTEDIPKDMLSEYLKFDLLNTELIFIEQFAEATRKGMLPLITSQMQALRATTEMNWWGMAIDWNFVRRSSEVLLDRELELAATFDANIKTLSSDGSIPSALNWGSNKDVSMLFFGGTLKYKKEELVGKYKNGKDKYKLCEHIHVYSGIYKGDKSKFEKNASGYVVDDKVLEKIGGPVASAIRELREVKKQRTTYFENLETLRFPTSYIYPNLNHTATKTGRLSCTNPNLQNQTTDGGVKAAYVSRYGDDGVILELDYSQLEMVALAVLSNDSQLMHDIGSGVDMHSELYRSMYGSLPTKDQRKYFKRLTFGLVYGAGAKTLAENSGYSVKDCQIFIETFYTRYPDVKKYHNTLIDKAARERKVTSRHDPETKMPVGEFVLKSITGREYVFNEWPGKDYKTGKPKMSFSPTELKNWQVQGFATGDIVPMMVGVLQSKLEDVFYTEHGTTPVHLVMTVHDSVILDVHKDCLVKAAHLAKEVMESAPSYLKGTFGIDFCLSLQVGVSSGANWLEQSDLKL